MITTVFSGGSPSGPTQYSFLSGSKYFDDDGNRLAFKDVYPPNADA